MAFEFDEVVIGGGVVGAAIAYFLSAAGRRVALVDAGAAGGEGASRFSGGLVRAYDPDDVLAELSLRGARALQQWERLGIPGTSPLDACGLLYISTPEARARAERAADALKARGYAIELLSQPGRDNMFGCARPSYGGAWLYESKAGVADVRMTVRALLFGACERGATLFEHCPALSMAPEPRGVLVRLAHGELRAARVVVAAGIQAATWFPQLELHARTIPLTCVRASRPTRRLAIVDECSSTYVRPLRSDAFWCGSQHTQRFAHEAELEPYGEAHAADSLTRLRTLFGVADPGQVIGGLVGWDCYTPDARPRVGWLSDAKQVFVAAGFSGRGFKYALPLGAAVASALTDRAGLPAELTADLSVLAPQAASLRARCAIGESHDAEAVS